MRQRRSKPSPTSRARMEKESIETRRVALEVTVGAAASPSLLPWVQIPSQRQPWRGWSDGGPAILAAVAARLS